MKDLISNLFSGIGSTLVVFLLTFIYRRRTRVPKFEGDLSLESDRERLSNFLRNNFRRAVDVDLCGVENELPYVPPRTISLAYFDCNDSLNIIDYGNDFHYSVGHLVVTIKIVSYDMCQGCHFGAIVVSK